MLTVDVIGKVVVVAGVEAGFEDVLAALKLLKSDDCLDEYFEHCSELKSSGHYGGLASWNSKVR